MAEGNEEQGQGNCWKMDLGRVRWNKTKKKV